MTAARTPAATSLADRLFIAGICRGALAGPEPKSLAAT